MRSLKQLLDGRLGAVVAWAFILMMSFTVGVTAQWMLFSDGPFPDWSVMLRWPILWVVYFGAAICIGEHVTRWVAHRRGL